MGGLSIIMLLAAFSRHVMLRAKPEASPDQPTLRVVRFFACAPLRLRMTFLHSRKALGGLVGGLSIIMLLAAFSRHVMLRAKPEASPDQPTLRVVRFFACAPLRLRMTFLHSRKVGWWGYVDFGFSLGDGMCWLRLICGACWNHAAPDWYSALNINLYVPLACALKWGLNPNRTTCPRPSGMVERAASPAILSAPISHPLRSVSRSE